MIVLVFLIIVLTLLCYILLCIVLKTITWIKGIIVPIYKSSKAKILILQVHIQYNHTKGATEIISVIIIYMEVLKQKATQSSESYIIYFC